MPGCICLHQHLRGDMTEFWKPHQFSCSLWLVCVFPTPYPPPPRAVCSAAFQVPPSFLPSIFVFCLEAFTIAFHSIPAQVSPATVKGYELESSQTLKLTRRNTHDTHARAHTPPHTSTRAVLLHYPLHVVLSLVYLGRQTSVATNFVLLSHAYANITTNIS